MKDNRKAVLITGASKGLGAATAQLFAQAGWNVAINYHGDAIGAEGVADRVRALGVEAITLQADVSQGSAARALVDQAARQLGRLDAAICNASISHRPQPFVEMSWDSFRGKYEGEMSAAFHLAKATIPHFVEQGEGLCCKNREA